MTRVIPPFYKQTVRATNGTDMHVYGRNSLPLDLGRNHAFRWVFIVDDVPYTIIAADVLRPSHLPVDAGLGKFTDSRHLVGYPE